MYTGPGTPMMEPMLGSSHYPPSFSYAQSTGHADHRGSALLGNRLVTGGVGAAKGAIDMGQNLVMGAGMLNFASSLATRAGLMSAPILSSSLIGTGASSGLAMGLVGGPLGLGLMAGSAVLGLGTSGIQQANQVGNMFGNMQFVNPAGDPRTNRGFSQRDLMTLQRGIHNIEANNPFVSMSDALRATERFTEMGMHQGIQDAEKLAKRVTQLGKTMHEMARKLGTSMEEAGSIFRDMRGAGFYTARDVMGNTADMTLMRGYGMSSEQFATMQRSGAGMTRGAQMSGLAGARTMTAMTEQFMGAVKSGAMSPEQMMDITGASTPLEAAQMLAQQTLSGTMQGLSGGLGTAMLLAAGQVDESGRFTGGIDRGILESMAAGTMTRDQMSRIAGGKRNTKEGQASFVARRQDIMSSMLETGESQDALLGMIKSLTEQKYGAGAGENEDLLQLVAESQMNIDRRTLRSLLMLRDTRKQRMDEIVRNVRANDRAAEIKETRTLGGLYTRATGTLGDIYETAVMPFSEGYRDVVGGLQDVERSLLGGGYDVIAGTSEAAFNDAIIRGMSRERRGIYDPATKMAIGDAARIAATTGDFDILKAALPTVSAQTRQSMKANVDLKYEMDRLKETGGTLSDDVMRDLANRLNIGSEREGMFGSKVRTFDKDELYSLIAERGGNSGLQLVMDANVDRTEGVSGGAKTIKQLQIEAKRALYGEYGGRTDMDVAKYGKYSFVDSRFPLLGYALSVIDTDQEEAVSSLVEGGEASTLLAKYADNQKDIDSILSGVVSDADYEMAAKEINGRYSLRITGQDLKNVNRVLTDRFDGASASHRFKYGVNQEDAKKISASMRLLETTVADATRSERLGELVTAAKAHGIDPSGNASKTIRDAIKKLSTEKFSPGVDASEGDRILGYGVQVYNQLKQFESGGLQYSEIKKATGLSDELLSKILAQAGGTVEGDKVMTGDAEGLRATLAGLTTETLGRSGKAEQFLNAGLSDVERQSLSIYKTGVAIDSLYEKLKTENVIKVNNPESGTP
jgi:hypothetical protein